MALYSKSGVSLREETSLNDLYMPEFFVLNTQRKSHMADGEVFLWHLTTVVREALRQQRSRLVAQGKVEESGRVALYLVDAAPCHLAKSRGIRVRRDMLEKELNVRILDAPGHYSAAGQPCDQVHRSIQAKTDMFMRELTGEDATRFRSSLS